MARMGIISRRCHRSQQWPESCRQPAIKGVRIVALCDPDTAVLARAKRLDGINASSVQTFTDARELFGSAEIDAVTIATPNHWHSLAGIWACQAGSGC